MYSAFGKRALLTRIFKKNQSPGVKEPLGVACGYLRADRSPCCAVLEALQCGNLEAKYTRRLMSHYCRSGGFICCPIFMRLQGQLTDFDQRLRDP
jgi:hypothetical protein